MLLVIQMIGGVFSLYMGQHITRGKTMIREIVNKIANGMNIYNASFSRFCARNIFDAAKKGVDTLVRISEFNANWCTPV